jgi:hypothetical protein
MPFIRPCASSTLNAPISLLNAADETPGVNCSCCATAMLNTLLFPCKLGVELLFGLMPVPIGAAPNGTGLAAGVVVVRLGVAPVPVDNGTTAGLVPGAVLVAGAVIAIAGGIAGIAGVVLVTGDLGSDAVLVAGAVIAIAGGIAGIAGGVVTGVEPVAKATAGLGSGTVAGGAAIAIAGGIAGIGRGVATGVDPADDGAPGVFVSDIVLVAGAVIESDDGIAAGIAGFLISAGGVDESLSGIEGTGTVELLELLVGNIVVGLTVPVLADKAIDFGAKLVSGGMVGAILLLDRLEATTPGVEFELLVSGGVGGEVGAEIALATALLTPVGDAIDRAIAVLLMAIGLLSGLPAGVGVSPIESVFRI